MSEPSSDREIFGAKWAARICVALLLGLAIVTAIAFYDEHRLSALEKTEENSAVGDKAFFALPPEATLQNPPGSVVQFEGRPLYPLSFKEFKERDSRMIRQGFDDSKRFSVYSFSDRVKAGKQGEPFYFLKLSPGKYLKLSTISQKD